MANKPFEIQSSTLTIGGVDLQAGTTGVVIPGVTQATSYKVEEVEDTGDQTYNTYTNITVIDKALYDTIVAEGNVSGFADFTVQLDGDGYIDEIEVNGQGTYSAANADRAANNDMYAYIGTGSGGDRPLVPQDWIQIPFRPRMRAGDIENIGGGGGGANNISELNDVDISDPQNGQAIVWDENSEAWRNQTISGNTDTGDITFSGDEIGSTTDVVNINASEYAQLQSNNSYVWVEQDGAHIEVGDGEGLSEFTFEYNSGSSRLKLPVGGDIVDSTGNSVLSVSGNINQLVNPDSGDTLAIMDTGDIILDGEGPGGVDRGIVWKYGENNDGINSQVRQDEGGLTVRAWTENGPGNYSASVNIVTNQDANQRTWTFDGDGALTFPDETVQTTAYIGQEISPSVPRSDTAPVAANGQLWFNTLEGRMYIKYDDVWVDAAPLMTPAPEVDIDVATITFPDSTVQTTAFTGNKLTNGVHELILNTNGDLLSANDIIAVPDGRFIKDCGNSTSTTSMRWTNLPNNDNTQIIRLYTGDPEGNDSIERGKISIEWQTETISGLSISSFDNTDGTDEYKWEFRGDGTVKFPTLTVPISDNANPSGTGQTLKFSDSTQQAIIYGPASTADNNSAERVIIQGAPGYTGTSGEGGDVYLWAGPGGDANGNGGDIKVRAGYGNGSGQGGYLNFQAGDSSTGSGGWINIESGDGATNQGGTIDIVARNGGQVNLRTEQNGNIALNTNNGAHSWRLNNDGSTAFPSGAGFVRGDSGQLKTNDGTTLSLDLRDTSGRGFYTNNDGFSLRSNGSNTWVFGIGGNITLPTNTAAINYANGVSILDGLGGGSSYSNSNVTSYLPTHTGNVSANYFLGNGSQLTGITATNATTAATVTTNAQPNITSVGTLSGLTVGPNSSIVLSGTAGYLKANSLQGHDGSQTIYLHYGEVGGAAGIATNLTVGTTGSGSLTANGTISASGNITGDYFIGNGSQLTGVTVSTATTAATVTTNAQPNITSVGTLTSLNVTGTIAGGNLTTGGQVSATGNLTGANIITTGLLTVTGNVIGGNVNTANTISATGNIRSNSSFIATNVTGTITIGNTNSYMMGIGNANSYVQSYVHNKSNTSEASADMIVYGSAGTDNSGYMDMGMTSNNFSSSFFTVTGKSEGYLFMSGVTGTSGNMVLATGPDGSNNSIEFYVGGFSSAKGANRPLLVSNTGISVTGNITGNTNGFAIGYRDVPQVAASNATIALTDAGKHFYSTTAGNFTLTIPNNSTTSFSTGTAISIVVQAAGNILVNAASGVTLYMAGNSTAANRVVGAYGMATIMKVASDTWFVNGTGLS